MITIIFLKARIKLSVLRDKNNNCIFFFSFKSKKKENKYSTVLN